VFRDIGVSKVQNLPLAPWKRTGGRGSYIQLHGTEGKWGQLRHRGAGRRRAQPREAHLRGDLFRRRRPRHHEVWLDNDSKRHVFEWQKGSLFSIPGERLAPHRQRLVGASAVARRHHRAEPDEPDQQRRRDLRLPVSVRDRFSGADGLLQVQDDIEPDPCAGSRCGAPTRARHRQLRLPLDNRRSPASAASSRS